MKTEIIYRIANELSNANMIYIIGNGGSAALADHFACDLLKNCNLPAVSLCSNLALITAIANDISFEEIFTEQLKALVKQGDVLVAFSTRGTSPNIVSAAKYMTARHKFCIRKHDLRDEMVIGIAGFDGGELKKWSHEFYHIDSSNMQECEDEMNKICHAIYNVLVLEKE